MVLLVNAGLLFAPAAHGGTLSPSAPGVEQIARAARQPIEPCHHPHPPGDALKVKKASAPGKRNEASRFHYAASLVVIEPSAALHAKMALGDHLLQQDA